MLDPKAGEIFSFNKPYTMTSFRIVSKVRGILNNRLGIKDLKVGHAGTLDPLATGVLVVCTGKATKKINQLQTGTKEYVATLKLGATTPSFDMETAEDAIFPTWHITQELVEQTLKRFIGAIEQVPPRFSAVKVDGKRAFKLARKGEDIELKPKLLVIDEIELLDCHLPSDPDTTAPQPLHIKHLTPELLNETIPQNTELLAHQPSLRIRIVCSKGTYIRALARDIGLALGSGAYLTSLCRTRIGHYTLEDSHDIMQFEDWIDGQI